MISSRERALLTTFGVLAAICAAYYVGNRPHKTPKVPTEVANVRIPEAAPPHGVSNIRFTDTTVQSGIHYRWTIPGPHPYDILQTIGNGCAFLDYNADGNLDILLVGPKLALYCGDGHGHFQDVTNETGLDVIHGHLLGCCTGDYDNDGYDDIYLSAYRGGVLLHNQHGRTFADVTQQVGIAPQPWGTSCAFADVNGDGHLDLYIGNYVKYDPTRSKRLCSVGGVLTSCGPVDYGPEHGVLYLNTGRGRFGNVSSQWHLDHWGKNLGVAFADYDGSGKQSLYLANDEMPGEMQQNSGTSFRDVGRASGTAYDGRYKIHGGMGVDWGDYDNDGKLDLFVAAYRSEPKCVFHNTDGLFEDVSGRLGLSLWTPPYVAFGAKWLDCDNDGWLDLMIANGHVMDNVRQTDPDASYREPTQLFHNELGKRLANISAMTGPDVMRPIVGRGLAIGDYDNDGRVDALVVDSDGRPMLLHNETLPTRHWLLIKLIGTRCNRDGIGAIVALSAGGLTETRYCHSDGSYLSASDMRVHFGLGAAQGPISVKVRWPDGRTDVYRTPGVDQVIVLHERSAP